MGDFVARIGDELSVMVGGYIVNARIMNIRAYISEEGTLGATVTVAIDGEKKDVPIFLLKNWAERAKG